MLFVNMETNNAASKILVIDDDQLIRETLVSFLQIYGYEVASAEDGQSGLEIFAKFSPCVVVSDIRMPKMDGIEILKRIKETSPETGVILLTGHGSMNSTIEAMQLGAFDYITKPLDHKKLEISIRHNIALQQIRRERELLQAQLFESEKRASLSTFAAGTAHEINSPLAVVMAYIGQVQEILNGFQKVQVVDFEKMGEAINYLGTTEKSATRVQTIVRSLLAFTGQLMSSDWGATNPNDVIKNASAFLKNGLEKFGITTTLKLEEGLPPIWASAPQLESVFLALLSNSQDAFEALKEKAKINPHCQITISTSRHADGGVQIIYSDTAGGMNPETAQKIFNPFFTTKDLGRGKGLGMSVSLGVVQSHKGTITVESALDKGTSFTLTFPAHMDKGG